MSLLKKTLSFVSAAMGTLFVVNASDVNPLEREHDLNFSNVDSEYEIEEVDNYHSFKINNENEEKPTEWIEIDEDTKTIRYYNLKKDSIKHKLSMIFVKESILDEQIDENSLTVDGKKYDVRDLILKYGKTLNHKKDKHAPPCYENWIVGKHAPPCDEYRTNKESKVIRFQNR